MEVVKTLLENGINTGLWDSSDRTMLDFMAELQTARIREAMSKKYLLLPLPSLNTALLMSNGILLTVSVPNSAFLLQFLFRLAHVEEESLHKSQVF